jgi:hypothetical protein
MPLRRLHDSVLEYIGYPPFDVEKFGTLAMKKCKAIDILLQDETQQALFSWHADDKDIKASLQMTTVIINLSTSESAMRVWGFQPFIYSKPGECSMFAGAALHESVPRLPHHPAKSLVRKVVFFFD